MSLDRNFGVNKDLLCYQLFQEKNTKSKKTKNKQTNKKQKQKTPKQHQQTNKQTIQS